MMTIAGWLMALVGPLVVRAIISLGFTAVVFTGVTSLVNQLISTAQSNWQSLPVSIMQLATLSGIPEVLGMIFGAYMARVAMWSAVGAAKYVFKK